jgi:multidrug efflux pump
MRHAMGVAVFFGMLGVTFFGLFLTPVFYVLLRALEKKLTRTEAVHRHVTEPGGAGPGGAAIDPGGAA